MKQKRQVRIVVLLTFLMAFLANVLSGSAVAGDLYSWTDENGVLHYSDMPPNGQSVQTVKDKASPPPSTYESNSVPGSTQPDTAIDAMTGEEGEGAEDSPPQSFADARREQIAKNRKERREAQAEMDRMCEIHRKTLANVEPSRRVMYKNEKGEVMRMDDDKRIALVKESKAFIAKNCD
jgi:hypothetical protein